MLILHQRSCTAKDVIFIMLDDETGIVYLMVRCVIHERFQHAVIIKRLLRITGRLQRAHDVTYILTEEI